MNDDPATRLRSFPRRFALLYFLLYSFAQLPHPLGMLPGLTHLQERWTASLPFVGERLLGLDGPISITPTGSGDTTAEYVRVVMILALALIGGLVWALRDRDGSGYPRLATWSSVWARYWLASTMILYGLYKLAKMQFPFPDVESLAEPYGESSPMRLAWTFMGYSTSYNVFTGGAEVLGGMLLLWRRTTSLGALVCVGVLANVVMLNFGYDIPVKLFSSHLLLVALVLVSLDAGRLRAVLLSDRAVPARELPPVLAERRKLRLGLKSAYIVLMLGLGVTEIVVSSLQLGVIGPPPPLHGLYDVTNDERDGPAAADESSRWRQLAIGRYGQLTLYRLHGPGVRYLAKPDTDAHTLELTLRDGDGEGEPIVLRYEPSEADVLVLDGTIDGVHHRATLRPVDESSLLLVDRGFHWVNEAAFNR